MPYCSSEKIYTNRSKIQSKGGDSIIAGTQHLRSEVGRSLFPSREINGVFRLRTEDIWGSASNNDSTANITCKIYSEEIA